MHGCGTVQWYSHTERQSVSPSKCQTQLTLSPAISLLGTEEKATTCPHGNLPVDVHSSILRNGQEEKTQMPVSHRVDKQGVKRTLK